VNTGTRLFEHQAGGSRGVAAYPPRVDAFTAQAFENPFAGGIRAQAAHPRDAQAKPGKPDAGIALGAGVIDEKVLGTANNLARRWGQRDHGFAKSDKVVQHFGFDGYFIAERRELPLTQQFTT
jgi:hypothetical protein